MKLILLMIGVVLAGTLQAKKKEREMIGCQPIYEDRVFMGATEVSNIMYFEFLYHQKKKGVDINPLLPDTTVWRTEGAYNEPYVEYYFRHPAYRDYPLVGVSKEQAESYCEWLSEALTGIYRENEKSDIDSVVVRLPTKMEWIDAAKGANDYYEYPWEGHSLRMEEGKFQGMFRVNCVRGRGDYMGIAGSLNDAADVTAPIYSYWPNDLGLYNCSGNVAEMISDDNVAMGGSWRSLGHDVKVTSEKRMDGASAEIGFRYVVEVVKLKPQKSEKLEIDKKFVGMNLSEMDTTIYSKFEVSNKLYNLFLKETKHPVQDTTVWNDQLIYSNWYTCNYRWHAMYENYPVVGVTTEDALAFCSWLTKKLQPYYDYSIEVDLPTEVEWETGARGDLSFSPYPWGGPYVRNAKGCLLGNHRYVPDAFGSRTEEGEWITVYPKDKHDMFGADQDGALISAAVDSYNPNGFGLYNMAGNVRELIKDSHLVVENEGPFTRGGGWNSIEYYMQNSSREFYESLPQADIGFRFVIRKKS